MIAAASSVLGALAGVLIARSVDDETGWYGTYFLIFGCVLSSVAGIVAGWLGILFAGVLVLGLAYRSSVIVAVGATTLALVGSSLVWEILLVALIPATGYLFSLGARKQLWWFLLIPIVIISWSFLL